MVVGNEMTQPLTLHSHTHTRFIWLLPACCYSIYYTYFDFHAAHTQHTHIAPQQHVHPHYLETFVVQTIVVCNEFWVRAVRKMFLGARICNAFRHIHKPCLIIQNIFIVIIIVQCTDLQTSNRNKVYGFILVVCVCTWWADILYRLSKCNSIRLFYAYYSILYVIYLGDVLCMLAGVDENAWYATHAASNTRWLDFQMSLHIWRRIKGGIDCEIVCCEQKKCFAGFWRFSNIQLEQFVLSALGARA